MESEHYINKLIKEDKLKRDVKKVLLWNDNLNDCINIIIRYLSFKNKRLPTYDELALYFSDLGFEAKFSQEYQYETIDNRMRKGLKLFKNSFDINKIPYANPFKSYDFYYGMVQKNIRAEDLIYGLNKKENKLKRQEFQFVLWILTSQIRKNFGFVELRRKYFLGKLKPVYKQKTGRSIFRQKLSYIVSALERRGLIKVQRVNGSKNRYLYGENNIWETIDDMNIGK